MPLPTSINDLSTTAGSNSPAGTENPQTFDDYLRVYSSYIAALRDVVLSGTANLSTANLAYTGTLTGSTGVVNIGSGQIYKDSSGNLGLGTVPASILHASSASATANIIATTGNASFRLGDSVAGATRKEFTITLDNTNNRVDIQAIQQGVASRDITINGSGGNVGIGFLSGLSGSAAGASLDAGVLAARSQLNTHQTSKAVFQYSTAGNLAMIRSYGATAGTGAIAFNVGGGGATTDFEAARIDSSGNLGVGTLSPSRRLEVSSTTSGVAALRNSAGLGVNLTFADTSNSSAIETNNGSLIFYNANNTVERMRIKSTGQINLTGLAAAPSGAAGDIYYDSVTNKHYGHNGTSWNAMY